MKFFRHKGENCFICDKSEFVDGIKNGLSINFNSKLNLLRFGIYKSGNREGLWLFKNKKDQYFQQFFKNGEPVPIKPEIQKMID